MTDKLLTMREAVARLVPDGARVACGLALEAAIPFAFAHEVIRQRRRDLHLIGPIADVIFDQLVGAGCVAVIEAAWVGNVTTGAGYCFRRAVEAGRPRPLTVRASGRGWTAGCSGSRTGRATWRRWGAAMAELEPTRRELMVARTSREIGDGDVVFVGMPLPLLAFALAVSTHAPGAVGAFENGVLRDTPPRGVVAATPWDWPDGAPPAVPLTEVPDRRVLETLRSLDPERVWTADA